MLASLWIKKKVTEELKDVLGTSLQAILAEREMLFLKVVTFLFPSCTQALASPFQLSTTAEQTKVLSRI